MEVPDEEFRHSPLSSALYGLAGAGIFVSLWWLQVQSPGGWSHLDNVQFLLMVVFGGIGLVPIAIAIQQVRRRFVIDRTGVRILPQGELVPWTSIAGLRATGLRGDLQLIGRHGEELGRLPAGIDRFERAVLLLSAHAPSPVQVEARSRVAGGYGVSGWLFLLIGGWTVVSEFTPRDRAFFDHPVALIVSAGLLALMLWKMIRLWRRTGDFGVTIDREGIRFEGRAGGWQVRWGEIREITPQLGRRMSAADGAVWLRLLDGRKLEIPLAGLDLHATLSALREFGGAAAASLTPPREPPPSSLLTRSF